MKQKIFFCWLTLALTIQQNAHAVHTVACLTSINNFLSILTKVTVSPENLDIKKVRQDLANLGDYQSRWGADEATFRIEIEKISRRANSPESISNGTRQRIFSEARSYTSKLNALGAVESFAREVRTFDATADFSSLSEHDILILDWIKRRAQAAIDTIPSDAEVSELQLAAATNDLLRFLDFVQIPREARRLNPLQRAFEEEKMSHAFSNARTEVISGGVDRAVLGGLDHKVSNSLNTFARQLRISDQAVAQKLRSINHEGREALGDNIPDLLLAQLTKANLLHNRSASADDVIELFTEFDKLSSESIFTNTYAKQSWR